MNTVASGLRGCLAENQTALSIAAGVRLSAVAKRLGHKAVIRVMPNTPAQVMAGMSVWTAAPEVSDDARKTTERLLEAMGRQLYVANEKYIDMATALSASGPAYVWALPRSLHRRRRPHRPPPAHGLRPRPSRPSWAALKWAAQTQRHPAELRNMVTSPGGTTTDALLTLEEAASAPPSSRPCRDAYEKSQLLGQEN